MQTFLDSIHSNTTDCDSGLQSCTHLRPFEMHGWAPDADLSEDDNFLDMVMLITRNSTCRGGSMACVIARPQHDNPTTEQSPDEFSQSLLNSIVSAATNQPLYSEQDSDVHAEITALGQACRRGDPTEGCTAYITMPPCKNCLGALVMAGIRRIVTRRKPPVYIEPVAMKHGIQVHIMDDNEERKARIDALVSTSKQNGEVAYDPDERMIKSTKHDNF